MTVFKFREEVSIDKLEIIVNNDRDIYEYLCSEEDCKENDEDFKKFSTMMRNLLVQKKKSDYVTYGYGRNRSWGRRFSKTPSLQNCWRSIRHTISDGMYYDLDVKNSAPTCLYELHNKLEWGNDYMNHYI